MIYPDASAVVALFKAGAHSADAKASLGDPATKRLTSDFTLAEVSAALAAQYRGRRGAEPLTRLLQAADVWFGSAGPLITVVPADVAAATGFVRRLDCRLRAPDALHLAICRRVGAALLTFDANQAAAATVLGIPLAV